MFAVGLESPVLSRILIDSCCGTQNPRFYLFVVGLEPLVLFIYRCRGTQTLQSCLFAVRLEPLVLFIYRCSGTQTVQLCLFAVGLETLVLFIYRCCETQTLQSCLFVMGLDLWSYLFTVVMGLKPSDLVYLSLLWDSNPRSCLPAVASCLNQYTCTFHDHAI